MPVTRLDELRLIFKMVASGEIPNEVYNKYLGKTKLGFMTEEAINRHFEGLIFNPEIVEYEPNIQLDEVSEDVDLKIQI